MILALVSPVGSTLVETKRAAIGSGPKKSGALSPSPGRSKWSLSSALGTVTEAIGIITSTLEADGLAVSTVSVPLTSPKMP